MNGEPYRADEYGFTVARTSERFVDAADFLAPADCWGDVGAASGPLYLGLAAAAGRRRYSQGPYWLAWTSSESGERCAALLHVGDFGTGGAI
jgi:3-oxoacyl-[acyl-carrier-protein] synthase-1